MARTDIHLDAMLRHLGAAYYESLHGRATRADVTRALDTVEEHLHEQARHPARPYATPHEDGGLARPRGWGRRVADVMTTTVVTVDRITPYKQIARLLAEHRISGLPVLKMGRQVAGVVTEADLLTAQQTTARRVHAAARRTWWPRRQPHPALTAGELMTTPAVTITPDATIPAAARLMTTLHIRRLPVVDKDGKLAGVVSRRDLLSVFLRPDNDIAADARKVLDEILPGDGEHAGIAVRNGVITLTGTLPPTETNHDDLLPLAIRLMWDVDGVIDINDQTGQTSETTTTQPAQTG